ncbi:PLP-dependent aminotransferase family protein [Streptomyces sp. MP131-18]|uniref:aminotransferase-like domain-containing protein n=1 Tax=Streptomyces sp. MP131-18 TaxID=1857892 RepID=UPI00097CBAAE|nr:PLP-dependent aminotransferase family protein [Streptomyces sp. MP131-18]ONK15810.1 putative HTH-type transcriptional regulator YjiR [Streptomyces sp. MP131-18]
MSGPELASRAARLTPFRYQGDKPAVLWSFTGGFPDPAHFPVRELSDCLAAAAGEDPELLQYGSSADESLRYGERSLRQALLTRHGDDLPPGACLANVMLTQGGIGAIELAFRSFVDPGDAVVVEAPTWGVALTLARQLRADVHAVPAGPAGLDVDALEAKLDALRAAGRPAKIVYTIPTFQTPTGTVMPAANRRRLAALAARHDAIVVEDGTYAALRYDGLAQPSVQSFDTEGRVLRVGSFSKTVAPALRTGWVTGDRALLSVLASARSDLGVSQWAARALALFLESGQYDAHLSRMLAAYRRKRDVLDAALRRECAGLAEWSVPDGGYFFWLRLREHVDAGKAKRLARERGIAARPGEQFFGTPGDGGQLLRIAFSQVAEERIPGGIAALGEALRSGAAGAAAPERGTDTARPEGGR